MDRSTTGKRPMDAKQTIGRLEKLLVTDPEACCTNIELWISLQCVLNVFHLDRLVSHQI